MINYYEKLQEIKKNDSPYMKIRYARKDVFLKLVDESDETVKLLYNWRKKYRNMFATDFEMSPEKTKRWIQKDILKNPTSILFIIIVEGEKIGNIGTSTYDEKTNSASLDNMMKEPTYDFPGLMTVIEKVFLRWMFDELNLSKITGFLFSDNEKMMNVHKKCGWRIIETVPIEQNKINGILKWQETKTKNEKTKRYFNKIELTKENLMKNFGNIEFKILNH